MTESTQHVHHTHEQQVDRPVQCAERDREQLRVPTIADIVPLTEIMSRDITCAGRELAAERVAELMVRSHIGCVPVVEDSGRPVGMITKLDLVERLVGRDVLATHTAGSLMMPMSIALNERATIAHAAALMANEDIHHLFVVDGEHRLIGVVSTLDIVRWLARNDGFSASAAK